MSEKKPPVFVALRRSGVPVKFKSSGLSSAELPYYEGDYLDLLAAIANELMSAGSNHDAPTQLLMNGKQVIASGLSRLAFQYRQDSTAAAEAASRAVRNIHIPDWAPDHKPGYNPPGIDVWSCSKRKSA